MKLTKKNFLSFLPLLRIDIFMILINVGGRIADLSLNQLIEDKICFNQLKLNQSICLNIENVDKSLETDKNYVLTRAANYKNYQQLIETLPEIFLSFLVGFWLDSYPEYTKFILTIPALGIFIESLITIVNCLIFQADYRYILIASIFKGVTGGFPVVFIGVYSYVARKTSLKYRAIRFAILVFFVGMAYPIYTYLGGLVLTSKPWIAGQPRNYIGVYILSAIFSLISAVWILLLLNEARVLDNEESGETKNKRSDQLAEFECPSEAVDKSDKRQHTFFDAFPQIFRFTNLKAVVQTCYKKRENGIRCRIFHVLMISFFFFICYDSEIIIGFPFAQKVYHWDASYYSKITPIFTLISSSCSSIVVPILVRIFAITDTKLAIIGCISLMLSIAIRGFWLSPTGFIVSHSINVLANLKLISFRAVLSGMVKPDEIGKVYSVFSVIEFFAPFISSIFFTKVFAATINFNPGIAYLIASALLIYPLIVDSWLDLTKSSWYYISDH